VDLLQFRAAAATSAPNAQYRDDTTFDVGLEVDVPPCFLHEPASDNDSVALEIRPRDQRLLQDLAAHFCEFLGKEPGCVPAILAPSVVSGLDVLLRLP
jgi:hypothetical protein